MSRVLLFPVLTENPYLPILVRGLQDRGIVAEGWSLRQKALPCDAFHLHWVESAAGGPLARRNHIAAVLAFLWFRRTLRRVKRAGGRIVWTAHNLRPHERQPSRRERMMERWLRAIYREVDTVIALSHAGKAAVQALYPEIGADYVVIPHQHYIGSLPAPSARPLRHELGIPADGFVVGMIGLVRPYKQIASSIRAFVAVHQPDEYLVVAGFCWDEELADLVRGEAEASANVIVVLRRLSDQEFVDFYAACSASLCAQREMLNSGTVLAALSLNRPVIGTMTGALPEIAEKVGSNWMYLVPEIDPAGLRSAMDAVRSGSRDRPDLSFFDPAKIVEQHIAAYRLGEERSPMGSIR